MYAALGLTLLALTTAPTPEPWRVAHPQPAPTGTVIVMTGWYENTEDNPLVDPEVWATRGARTSMVPEPMVTFLGRAFPIRTTFARPSSSRSWLRAM